MENVSDDCLIYILRKLSFTQNVHLESLCKRWNRVLKTPIIYYSHMKKLNISNHIGNNPEKYFEQTNNTLDVVVHEVLKRGGQLTEEFTFDSRWLKITQPIVQHIATYCKNLRKLDIGCVALSADISPLIDSVGEHLEELIMDESRWTDEEDANKYDVKQNKEIKFTAALCKLKVLRKINLRKFDSPLDTICALPETLRVVDLSDANGLTPEVFLNFIYTHCSLENLTLSPMPQFCLRLFSTSTTTAINQPDPYIGFIKRNFEKNPRRSTKQINRSADASKNKADLQSIINAFEKLKALKFLEIGYIAYSTQFLSLAPLSQLEFLKTLNIKDCNAINSEVLRTVLTKLKKLKSFSLRNCIKIDDYSAIIMCKELTELEIENSPHLSDSDLEKISQSNTLLKRLRIKQCPKITDISVTQVAKNCPLREIDLSKCENVSENLFVDPNPYKDLFLEKISLLGCHLITKKTISQMLEAIKLEKLRELDISLNKNIDYTSVEDIGKKMRMLDNRNKTLVIYCFGTSMNNDSENKTPAHIELVF